MGKDEVLADLNERLDRAIASLENMAVVASKQGEGMEHTRLTSKAEGFKVVKDWLRGYR